MEADTPVIVVANEGELPTIRVPDHWAPAAFEHRYYCPRCWEILEAPSPGWSCGRCYRRGQRVLLVPLEGA